MGVPTSEVGYTSATTGRETTKSIRDMWWHLIKKIFYVYLLQKQKPL
jgi:Tol biopolymer transport system component